MTYGVFLVQILRTTIKSAFVCGLLAIAPLGAAYAQDAGAEDEVQEIIIVVPPPSEAQPPLPDPEDTGAVNLVTPDVGQTLPSLVLLPENEEDEEQVYRSVQAELNRLGCKAGKADGKWGGNSEGALNRLVAERPELAGYDPSTTLLDLLGELPANVCPLVCSAREEIVGGACQLKTCASGQYLDSKGTCRTRQATVKKATPTPKATTTVRKKKCVSYNGRSYCS
ncbi:hypothetical protein IV417_10735 [Alphaproteobacteria bacterium KMM 3653]|uniref:Secreted protein n=1 Tax=Harenicola maris TaxID=2841044 RepID=A0AAP2G8F1_9RHOB|nr:hypothetical protein [Harenicola maris]